MEEKRETYLKILEKSPCLHQAALKIMKGDGNKLTGERDTISMGAVLVFGPALGAFLLWLLRDALLSGKERLYFMSRDGYFFWKGAQILCRDHNLPLDCRYLSCSRYSLRVPGYHWDHGEALDFICRDGLQVTPQILLARAALTEEEIREVLRELELPWAEEDMIPRRGLSLVREQLAKSQTFLSRMDAHSREALPLLEAYLSQEGLREAAGDALVDSGWMGSVQKTLGRVLKDMGRKTPLEGYYWGLYDIPNGMRRRDYRSFYFSPEGDLHRKARFQNCLFEAIFTAPHGMTLEYRDCDGCIVPVYASLQEQRKTITLRMGRDLLNYLEAFSQNLDRRDFFQRGDNRNRKVVERLLDSLMLYPSLKEAESYGAIPFCDDIIGQEERPLAEPLKKEHKSRPFGQSAWYPGSQVLTGKEGNSHPGAYLSFQYIRQMRRMYEYHSRKRKGEILP